MADDNTNHEPDRPADFTAPDAGDSPEAIVVPMPEIATQEASTVGDENMEPRKPSVEVNQESVPAQVMGQPAPAVETVPVHETYVALDRVITDTSDPLAVQIPDAGRGDPSLPIHSISGPTVEQVFAKHAKDSDDDS